MNYQMRNEKWGRNRGRRDEFGSREEFGRRYREDDYGRDGEYDYADERRASASRPEEWNLDRSHYMGGSLDQGRLDYGRGRSYNDRKFETYGYQQDRAHERAEHGMWESVKNFFGIGPKGYKRSDERIREDVCEMLARHPGVDASEIEVNVVSASVTLTGTVPNRWMKRQAEDILEHVSGVDDIRNELVVKREGDASYRDGRDQERVNQDVKGASRPDTKNSLI